MKRNNVLRGGIALLLAAGMVGGAVSAVAAEEKVTLTILKAEAQNTEAWEAVCAKFTEEYPNIEVLVEAYDNDLQAVLATRLASGEYPDIFTSQPYESCRPYVEYCYDMAGSELLDLVDPASVPSTVINDVVTGVCLYGDAEGLIYNKAVFEELGLTPPKTLTEFKEVCQALKDAGYTPMSNGYKEGWVIQDIMSAFMGAEGNLQENAQKVSAGEMTLADFKYINNMFDFIDICLEYSDGATKSLETGYYDQISDIGAGKAVMTTQGNWMEQEAVAIDPELVIGFTGIPVDHEEEAAAIEVSPAWVYHIAKDSAHVEEAKTFLNWLMTNEEGRRFIGEDIGKLPLLTGEMPMVGNLNVDASAALQEGTARDIEQYYHPFGYETVIGEVMQQYVAGTASREDCLEMLTEEWLRLVSASE